MRLTQEDYDSDEEAYNTDSDDDHGHGGRHRGFRGRGGMSMVRDAPPDTVCVGAFCTLVRMVHHIYFAEVLCTTVLFLYVSNTKFWLEIHARFTRFQLPFPRPQNSQKCYVFIFSPSLPNAALRLLYAYDSLQ